ncbi:Alpha/beta hydrolase family-domain-containing protein [Aspergillus ambiguus]|uniref:alpha/beta hydrolase n=1 Tax=Aspergillus ambiguus TaxID=176160 RepID=UPI003CCE38D2
MTLCGPFHVIEHVVPCQHIRQYPAATVRKQEDILHLAVKQYIPIDNPSPKAGDVTFVTVPGNGFGKELYEPIWHELHGRAKNQGFRIRSIWAADLAQQGQSGLINAGRLGLDSNAFDHSRDLLHLINIKREEMPRPIVGIGHSVGGVALAQLSLMHPRLFHSIVLLDPVILRPVTLLRNNALYDHGILLSPPLQVATYRRDSWPSREAAADSFRRNPFYQTWDARVFDNLIKYGLRDVPKEGQELGNASTQRDGHSDKSVPVTLTTPLAQELTSFARPYYNLPVPDAGPDHPKNRLTHPDLDPELITSFPFYRPEPAQTFYQLPYLRPSVLYVFGGKSPLSQPELRIDKIQNTGIGVGGSGGFSAGRVREICLQDCSHQVPFEAVNDCAEAIARWFGGEIGRWCEEEKTFNDRKSLEEKTMVDKEWKRHVPKLQRGKSRL